MIKASISIKKTIFLCLLTVVSGLNIFCGDADLDIVDKAAIALKEYELDSVEEDAGDVIELAEDEITGSELEVEDVEAEEVFAQTKDIANKTFFQKHKKWVLPLLGVGGVASLALVLRAISRKTTKLSPQEPHYQVHKENLKKTFLQNWNNYLEEKDGYSKYLYADYNSDKDAFTKDLFNILEDSRDIRIFYYEDITRGTSYQGNETVYDNSFYVIQIGDFVNRRCISFYKERFGMQSLKNLIEELKNAFPKMLESSFAYCQRGTSAEELLSVTIENPLRLDFCKLSENGKNKIADFFYQKILSQDCDGLRGVLCNLDPTGFGHQLTKIQSIGSGNELLSCKIGLYKYACKLLNNKLNDQMRHQLLSLLCSARYPDSNWNPSRC